MFRDVKAFSGFSVDDVPAAKRFYGEVLGLEVRDGPMGTLDVVLGGGARVLIYDKGEAHEPASFTILNFPVRDLEAAVDGLVARGVAMQHYELRGAKVDARGIHRGEGPDIAWFTDPAGNVIAVLRED